MIEHADLVKAHVDHSLVKPVPLPTVLAPADTWIVNGTPKCELEQRCDITEEHIHLI